MFSLTDKNSLEYIDRLVKYSRESGDIPVYLVGNKSDDDNVCIAREEIDQLAQRYGVKFFRVSAKTGENVANVFEELARDALRVGTAVNPPQQEQPKDRCY